MTWLWSGAHSHTHRHTHTQISAWRAQRVECSSARVCALLELRLTEFQQHFALCECLIGVVEILALHIPPRKHPAHTPHHSARGTRAKAVHPHSRACTAPMHACRRGWRSPRRAAGHTTSPPTSTPRHAACRRPIAVRTRAARSIHTRHATGTSIFLTARVLPSDFRRASHTVANPPDLCTQRQRGGRSAVRQQRPPAPACGNACRRRGGGAGTGSNAPSGRRTSARHGAHARGSPELRAHFILVHCSARCGVGHKRPLPTTRAHRKVRSKWPTNVGNAHCRNVRGRPLEYDGEAEGGGGHRRGAGAGARRGRLFVGVCEPAL